jgi:hypothetical protein
MSGVWKDHQRVSMAGSGMIEMRNSGGNQRLQRNQTPWFRSYYKNTVRMYPLEGFRQKSDMI